MLISITFWCIHELWRNQFNALITEYGTFNVLVNTDCVEGVEIKNIMSLQRKILLLEILLEK